MRVRMLQEFEIDQPSGSHYITLRKDVEYDVSSEAAAQALLKANLAVPARINAYALTPFFDGKRWVKSGELAENVPYAVWKEAAELGVLRAEPVTS